MSIDYDKVEGFKALDQKEGKAALAAYAQETFSVKLNRQKSFDNMLTDLEQQTFKATPDLSELEEVAETVGVGETVWKDPVILAPDIPEVLKNSQGADVEVVSEPVVPHEESIVGVETPVSDSKPVSGIPVWLDGFTPSIYLMGRSASNNGYYTCPWWIYDWISQNPEWHVNPDRCPHASAIPTVKSLAYYLYTDGSVTVRETRNSRFITFEK